MIRRDTSAGIRRRVERPERVAMRDPPGREQSMPASTDSHEPLPAIADGVTYYSRF